MKRLLYLLVLLSSSVMSQEVEMSVGQTQYIKPDNGTWWQNGPASDGFHDNFKLRPISFTVGVTDYIKPGWRWRLGYAYLGEASSYATATRSDHQYNGVNGCVGTCPKLGEWHGKGSVGGVYLTVSPEWKRTPWGIFLEGGLWVYDPWMSMNVYGGTVGSKISATEYVEHNRRLEIGPVVGIGVSYKNTDLVWRAYRVDANGDGYPGIFQGYASNVSLRWRF